MKALPWIITAALAIALVVSVMGAKSLAQKLNAQLATNASLVTKISEQEAELQKMKEVAQMKTLPVRVTTRNASIAQGGVLQVENRGDEALALTLTIKRGDETKRKEFVLNPNAREDIGQLQGWAFVNGDTFELAANGFRSAHGTYGK